MPTAGSDERQGAGGVRTRQSAYDNVWAPYEARSIPNEARWGARGDLYEELCVTRLQDLVTLPTLTYEPSLLDRIQEASLSRAQVEAILFACQTFEMPLSDGTRYGFFLADGTGCGKGRSIAGLIFENYLRGRKRSIWLSANDDLRKDAERDMKAILPGDKNLPILSLDKFDGKKEEPPCGVLFLTYSALRQCQAEQVAQRTATSVKRFDRVRHWLNGKDFDGVIAFDEAHRVKNTGSLQGAAALSLQREFPKARILYASATAVNDVGEIEYMERLGLWNNSEGNMMLPTSFKDFDSLLFRGMVELVALSLKRKGMFASRTLSYEGVEYDTMTVNDTEMASKWKPQYTRCVGYWTRIRNEVFSPLKEAIRKVEDFLIACRQIKIEHHDVLNGKLVEFDLKLREVENNLPEFRATIMRPSVQLNSKQQRFFKEMLFAMKVDDIAKKTKKYVKDGFSVVIGVQSTHESLIVDKHREVASTKTFTSACGELVKGLVDTMSEAQLMACIHTLESLVCNLEAWIQENVRDGGEIAINLQAGEELKTTSETVKNALQSLRHCFDREDFPPASLDALIEKLGGHSIVAELTGRKLKEAKESGRVWLKAIGTSNRVDLKSFTEGRKHIAIISRAASTGFSLHSDKSFANRRRRIHIVAELPWSAIELVQQLGRTHRANEAAKPKYIFFLSNLSGETRFVSTLIQRLQVLGATSQGDHQAHRSLDALGSLDAESPLAVAALKILWDQILGIDIGATDGTDAPPRPPYAAWKKALEDGGFVYSPGNKGMQNFLNALLATTPDTQMGIFRKLEEEYLALLLKEGSRTPGPQWLQESTTKVKGSFDGQVIANHERGNQILLVTLVLNLSWDTVWNIYTVARRDRNREVCFKRRRIGAERTSEDVPRTCLCISGSKPLIPTGNGDDSMSSENERVWIRVQPDDERELKIVQTEWIKQQKEREEAYVLHGPIIPVTMLWNEFLKSSAAEGIFDSEIAPVSLENTCIPVVGKCSASSAVHVIHGLKLLLTLNQKEKFVKWATPFAKAHWKKRPVTRPTEPVVDERILPHCTACLRKWVDIQTVCLLPSGSWYCKECVTSTSEDGKYVEMKSGSSEPIDFCRIGLASKMCTLDEMPDEESVELNDTAVEEVSAEVDGSITLNGSFNTQQNVEQQQLQGRVAEMEQQLKDEERRKDKALADLEDSRKNLSKVQKDHHDTQIKVKELSKELEKLRLENEYTRKTQLPTVQVDKEEQVPQAVKVKDKKKKTSRRFKICSLM
eukprot:scaffold682_cov363-Pavlova_lutheri.AAC.22